MKRALIIGSLGQDGVLLSDYLRHIGYEVFGVDLDHVSENIHMPSFNIISRSDCADLITKILPEEIYYLAAYHSSAEAKSENDLVLWQNSYDVNALGLLNVLDSVAKYSSKTRVFYAGSVLIYSECAEEVITEDSAPAPGSIYGISKMLGKNFCNFYRKKRGLFVSCGILFNHESHLRKEEFLSGKVTQGAINIYKKLQDKLEVGDLSSKVDWSHAKDFVRAFWYILNKTEEPMDFVVASGEYHTVQDMVELTFSKLGLNWQNYVQMKSSIVLDKRPPHKGDASLLKKLTGWQPEFTFDSMIEDIIKERMRI